MDVKMKELLGVAASVAAGCETCLDQHVRAARKEGADHRDIQVAIQIARTVRLHAVTKIDDLATKLSQGETIDLAPVGGSGACGCGEGCDC